MIFSGESAINTNPIIDGRNYKSFIKKAPVFRVVISLTALLYPFKLSINDMNECTDYSLMGQRVVL